MKTLGKQAIANLKSTIQGIITSLARFTFNGDNLNVNISQTSGAQITSVDNATTTPLGAGATFTGASFESNDLSDVMVHVEADQDGIIFFDFSQDGGSNVDTFPFVGFAHVGNIPSFHIAVKGGQSFRVRFQNTSGSPQTFLRISTYYGGYRKPNAPVGTSINDSSDATTVKAVISGKTDSGEYNNVNTTPSGNLKATLFDSQTNSRQIVDLNGAAKMGEAIILVGDAFGQSVPNILQWITEFVGSGASITLSGTQRIETGTTADSRARFQSTKAGRFMISQFNIYHGGIFLDNLSDTDVERRWGAFDPINPSQNGVYFKRDGEDWFVCTSKGGVETAVPQASWTGTNAALFNATPGLAVYEIQYNAGSVFFFQGANFLHQISVAGSGGTYAEMYNFKVGLEVFNKNGNTTNNGIEFRAAGIYRLGEERGITISRVFDTDTLIKSTAGYCSHAYLSRTGSGGGSAVLLVFDGIDDNGELMARIDVGSDDLKGIPVNSTFSEGLFIEVSGSGTVNAIIGFE